MRRLLLVPEASPWLKLHRLQDQAVHQLFRDFYVFPEDAIGEFEKAGLVVKLDVSTPDKLKQAYED